MNLRPTKKKVFFSLLVTVFVYGPVEFVSFLMRCSCKIDAWDNSIDYQYLSPLQGGCHCGSTSLLTVIILYLVLIIAPFTITYLLMSRDKSKEQVLKK